MHSKVDSSEGAADVKQDYGITVTDASVSNIDSAENDQVSIIKSHKLSSKLKWKIDLMVMPFFMTIYFLQFLDKTLINYAAIMGLKKNLKGNEFSNLGTIFYVSYLATEPLAAYLIQKVHVGKFLGLNICCWGAMVACHAATKTYASLMVIRVLLGIFEASVPACLVIIGGKWWTRPEQSRRTFFWYMQVGVATIVGSLMSFGFQHVQNTTIESWQIMFVFMGILTFVVGVLTFVFLPESPLKCRFLTDEEKEEVMQHIKENRTGFENKTYKFYQVKEMLMEKETWIIFFIVVFSLTDGGSLSTFSSQIMVTFGFSSKISALVQIPIGFVAIISTYFCCYLTSYVGERSIVMACVTVPTILGAALFIGLPNSYKVGKMFGVYLLNFNNAIIGQVYSWNAANTAGYTKRNARNAMTLMAFCIGNLIGPQLFQAKDAPEYVPAKIVLLVFLCSSCALSIWLRFVVRHENKRRDRLTEGYTEEEKNKDILLLDLTDRENLNFRYAY